MWRYSIILSIPTHHAPKGLASIPTAEAEGFTLDLIKIRYNSAVWSMKRS